MTPQHRLDTDTIASENQIQAAQRVAEAHNRDFPDAMIWTYETALALAITYGLHDLEDQYCKPKQP